MSGSGLKVNGSGWEWIRVSGSELECVGVDGSRWEWMGWVGARFSITLISKKLPMVSF